MKKGIKASRQGVAVKEQKDNTVLLRVLKGSLIALIISLVLVLVFAFILSFVPLSDGVIAPINQVIRGVSILVGTIIALKKSKEMGLISGIIIGFIYTILSLLVFSILSGGFEISKTILNDLAFASIIGGISGIIAVNLK
jgi:putative membrane protein (TIGR04086 family)